MIKINTRTVPLLGKEFVYHVSQIEQLAEQWADLNNVTLNSADAPPLFRERKECPPIRYLEAENNCAFMFYRRQVLAVSDEMDEELFKYAAAVREIDALLKQSSDYESQGGQLARACFVEGPYEEKFHARDKERKCNFTVRYYKYPDYKTQLDVIIDGSFSHINVKQLAAGNAFCNTLVDTITRRQKSDNADTSSIIIPEDTANLDQVKEFMYIMFES